jgi:hypothetical protein
VRDFVGTVAQAGCGTFVAHARIAVLKGLSPRKTVKSRRFSTIWFTGSSATFRRSRS